MHNPNLIKGEYPEIGNPDHIEYYKKQCDIMGGNVPVCEIEFELCKYTGDVNGKPMHKYVEDWQCDSVLFYALCPKCKRLNKMLITGYDNQIPYESLIQIEKGLEEEPFECFNCGLGFEYDSELRQVFVKQ